MFEDSFEELTEDEQFDEGVYLLYPNADEDELEEELMSQLDKIYD